MQGMEIEKIETNNKKDIQIGMFNLIGITTFTIVGLIIKHLLF